MAEVAGGEQRARLTQVGADRSVRRVELLVDDRALAAEPQPVLAILSVTLDREDRVDAVRLADLEVLFAMIRRHVDEAGARIGGDVVAGDERTRLGEEAAEMVHRVAGNRTFELRSGDDDGIAAIEGANSSILEPLHELRDERLRHEISGCRGVLPQQCIVDVRAVSDRLVSRDCPRRGGPDYGLDVWPFQLVSEPRM